ncbi:hypothetical protein DPMN_115337 [Dreissena polymorpha]|uniref:Uncharacterized protein n=1 Tax=Dreissena polymorpha TaxID=45954 RepID=A0A9D4KMM3_DREPO|nr:hypothetical protein DPMN_115337 [Dreissena polymorpha]
MLVRVVTARARRHTYVNLDEQLGELWDRYVEREMTSKYPRQDRGGMCVDLLKPDLNTARQIRLLDTQIRANEPDQTGAEKAASQFA